MISLRDAISYVKSIIEAEEAEKRAVEDVGDEAAAADQTEDAGSRQAREISGAPNSEGRTEHEAIGAVLSASTKGAAEPAFLEDPRANAGATAASPDAKEAAQAERSRKEERAAFLLLLQALSGGHADAFDRISQLQRVLRAYAETAKL